MFRSSGQRTLRFVALALGLIGLDNVSVRAQEALHEAVQEDGAYKARQNQDIGPYKLRAGPMFFAADFAVGVELNSNVNLRSKNPTNDLIIRPTIQLTGIFPVTKDSRISFGLAFGYQKYLRFSENDRAYVRPNSELAYDIVARDLTLTLYDRFLYDQDVAASTGVSGATNIFPRFDNTVGMRVSWNPNQLVLAFGYGHQTFLTSGSDFEYLNRSAEQLFGRLGYRLFPATTAGIELSGTLTAYDLRIQRDNQSISAGPFFEWQVTPTLNLSMRGSYVHYSFDPVSTNAGYKLDSFYAGVDLTHHLTDFITHGLSIFHEIQPGFQRDSDYIETTTARYFANWNMTRHSSLGLNVYYDNGKQPNTVGQTEFYNRFGGGLALLHRLTDRFSVSVAYDYSKRDSNLADRNYDQHRVTFGLNFTM